jgi:hypothetical protein
VESNQVNVLALSVLRDLQQIDDAQETRLSRQLWSNLKKANRLDGIYLDLTFLHAVAGAHLCVRTRPDSDAACDFATTYSLAKTLGEYHKESLQSGGQGNAGNTGQTGLILSKIERR